MELLFEMSGQHVSYETIVWNRQLHPPSFVRACVVRACLRACICNFDYSIALVTRRPERGRGREWEGERGKKQKNNSSLALTEEEEEVMYIDCAVVLVVVYKK